MNILTQQLMAPFPIEDIHQRVLKLSNEKDTGLVANYINARAVMERLDNVVGPENWQRDYKEVTGNLFAGVAIRFSESGNDVWVWKFDNGVGSYTEKEKGASSDSFKRAAVNWGIGRFLYRIPGAWIQVKPVGKTHVFEEQALKNYRERLAGYLDSFPKPEAQEPSGTEAREADAQVSLPSQAGLPARVGATRFDQLPA